MRYIWWVFRAGTWASLITIVLLVPGEPGGTMAGTTAGIQTRVREAYGQLPLAFEANQGQTDGQVQFLARRPGMSLFLTPTEAVLVLQSQPRPDRSREPGVGARWRERASEHRAPPPASPPRAPTVLRLHFVGGNPVPAVVGLEQLPGTSNYFLGNDPTQWRTHIPTYAKVQYQEVYAGIDVVYYGNPRQLEYDVLVAPGADPSAITLALTWEGEAGTPLQVDAAGALVLATGDGALRLQPPVVYQEGAGGRHVIPCQYVLVPGPASGAQGAQAAGGTAQVRFQVAAYDRGQPLMIDPVVSYSTYLGGSSFDAGSGIAVDGAGQAYVTGQTNSTNFPTTLGAFQPTFGGGGADAFVTKFAFPVVAPIPALSPLALALAVVVLGVSGLLVLRRRLSSAG